MPRNSRAVLAGIPYHITQRGTNRQPVFFSIADRKLYLRLIRESLDEAAARVLAYCLMSNHVHFIVVPGREDSLAVLFGRANGRFAQATNIERGRCGHLWQARFHSCPMSQTHLWIGLRYVEENPCRAGIAASPASYRWSSAAAHLTGARDQSGILDLDFWRKAGGVETWAEMYAAPEIAAKIGELRKCSYAGRPFGEDWFVEQMEERFGRRWRYPTEKTGVKLAKFA
jgi:putative transposase